MEGKKILIVDDEKNIRNVIKEYAKFDGFETFEAEDGMQAVEMYIFQWNILNKCVMNRLM